MIGIVLVTHGAFGEELLRTSEMIVGKQDNVEVIAMEYGSSLQDIADKLEEAIKKFEKTGALVFTDMFGGSPSNVAMAYLGAENVEVISGVNLPMVIKAFSMRMGETTIADMSKGCSEVGRDSIKVAGDLLNK